MLTEADFHASWDVLRQLGDRYMVIFNGGPDAGSSVAHKHLQVFPRPDWRTIIDDMIKEPSTVILPFQNRVAALQTATRYGALFSLYQSMCKELDIENGTAHSMILVKEWLAVIPRSGATIAGEIEDNLLQGGANAMIGMLWMKTPEQFDNWQTYGPMKVLTEFGRTVVKEQ